MTWEAVEVLLANGKRIRVVLEASVGAFGIHQRIWGEQPVGPGWTVTHRAAGFVVWTVVHYADAIKVATWLDEKSGVPKERDAFVQWRNKLTDSARTALMAQLQVIAPRYQHGGTSSARV